MKIRLFAVIPFALMGAARAEPLHATGPLPGYVRMSLNVAPGVMLDPTKAVPPNAYPRS